ncbi:MAG: N-acetylmuramic acid 6-phosphate etherase, partial [Verrucomicrobiae bacterium]|nr:N-acetylmuramic acid 6-phosphate etherase [Verrucomicrobiae bacterium]
MTEEIELKDKSRLLGIEGGGTHTTAVYKVGNRVETETFGPGNIYTVSEEQLRELFEQIHNRFSEVDCVVAGMAGARNESDFQKICLILQSLWKDAECVGTNDLEVGIANAEETNNVPAILLIAGTGSCAYGKTPGGKVVKTGAWGHVFGDLGSSYDAGIISLKLVAMDYDLNGKISQLGERILNLLSLNSMDDLVVWAKTASKSDIAGVAKVVFDMAGEDDELVDDVIKHVLVGLSHLTISCAHRLLSSDKQRVEVLVNGGIFEKNKWFVNLFSECVRQSLPHASVTDISGFSHLGAIKIAKKHYQNVCGEREVSIEKSKKEELPQKEDKMEDFWIHHLPVSTELSPTELPNPLSKGLDKMPLEDAVRLFLQEDAKIPDAILPFTNEISRAVEIIADSFKHGGRLIYVGAGTSGRIAALDAAECPPTFGVEPQMVQAIIAGGYRALQRSVEGAEDDFFAAESEICERNVGLCDVVFGVAASGTTRFVWGALSAAKKRGAKTILLCFNPNLKIPFDAVSYTHL